MAQFLISWPGSKAAESLPTWEFDTAENCTTVGVPISITTAYNGMTIDWGDGNVTTVASVDDYVHTYETPGQYHITVAYDDWENVELHTGNSSGSPITEARTSIAKVYKIPKVANTTFAYLFYQYTALTEVAADTFAENTQITLFSNTFYSCSSLTSIPEGLFDNNTAVTSFNNTFAYCTGLTSIPSGLFDYNTAVTVFYGAFAYCTGLTSIPSGLFDYNTAVTSFMYTFYYCSGLTNQTVYVGSTIVTGATSFMSNTGDGNTVYVPEGSTTEETFNAEQNLGATVATYAA